MAALQRFSLLRPVRGRAGGACGGGAEPNLNHSEAVCAAQGLRGPSGGRSAGAAAGARAPHAGPALRQAGRNAAISGRKRWKEKGIWPRHAAFFPRPEDFRPRAAFRAWRRRGGRPMFPRKRVNYEWWVSQHVHDQVGIPSHGRQRRRDGGRARRRAGRGPVRRTDSRPHRSRCGRRSRREGARGGAGSRSGSRSGSGPGRNPRRGAGGDRRRLDRRARRRRTRPPRRRPGPASAPLET